MAAVISERLLDGNHRLLDAEADEQLVRLVQSGHDAAFAAIVRRYERELKAQAQRLTSDGRGEDAVQQAFLNAFSSLQSGREVRHLRGWLHQILRNEVTRARLPLEAPLDAAAVHSEPLEDTVQRRVSAHAALVQLSALPERQRDALLATAVCGFPRAQVARTMGLSEGAVRQLVHRARARLRQAASAFIPFPVVKLFGAARSGVDAAPDAAVGAGTAASGGLVIKVGALLASGAVATGIAVTHTFPARHHLPPVAHGAGRQVGRTRAVVHGAPPPAPSVAPSVAASVINRVRLSEHGLAAGGVDGGAHDGQARLSGSKSGRHGGTGSGPGRGGGAGHGDHGSGRTDDGGSGRGPDGAGSVSRSGTGSGSQSGRDAGDHGSGSGSGGGSGSGSRDGGDSGSRSGSTTPLSGSAGTGSADGGTSRDGTASATAISATPSDGGGSSGGGSSSGGTSGGDGSNDGSSGGGSTTVTSGASTTETSGGSRDLSGSLDSSSS